MTAAQEYEERYRFPAGFAQMLFICVAFVLGGLFAHLPALLGAVELAVFGTGAVILLVVGLRMTRRTALRVDESGLAFGAPALNDPSTERVPWPDVRAARVSRQVEAPYLPLITVTRRGGQPQVSKQVKGWRLDRDRFVESVQAFAPDIRVTDDR